MITVSSELQTLLGSGRIRPKRIRLDFMEVNSSGDEEVFRRLDLDDGDELILGGTITMDAGQEVWRRLTLKLSAKDGTLRPEPGADTWVDKRVQLYIGYLLSSGTTEWIPVGRYIWEDPEYVHQLTTKEINLQGFDKAALVTGQPRGGFAARTTMASGTNIKTGIKALADSSDWDENRQILADVSETTPYKFEWEAGEPPWSAARQLAAIPANPSYLLYYDALGYLTLKSDPAQNTANSVLTYNTDPDSNGFSLVAGELTVKWLTSAVVNHYQALGLTTARPPVPVLGEATDTDASSPTRIASIGRRFRLHRPTPDRYLTSLAKANDISAYHLRKGKQLQQRVTFSAVEDPRLEPMDIITITDPDAAVSGRYQVLGISLSLHPREGKMTVTAAKVVAA